MSFPVAIRISWRPQYQHIDELHYDPAWSEFSHDCYNFLKSGKGHNSYFYGYFPRHTSDGVPKRVDYQRIDKGYDGGDFIECPRIYWLAKHPETNEVHLVGWYENAQILAHDYRNYPEQFGMVRDSGELVDITWRARSRVAFLIPEGMRPPLGDLRLMGFDALTLNLHRIIYLDDGNSATLDARLKLRAYLDELYEHIDAFAENSVDSLSLIEGRIERNSTRLERYGNTSIFRKALGSSCDCCGFDPSGAAVNGVWDSALEVHHKYPVSDLISEDMRSVTFQDFLLLCATCHRAIHAAAKMGHIANLSDVDGLRRILPPRLF